MNIRLSWGMTELSPCGVVGGVTRKMIKEGWSDDETLPYRLKQGKAMYGVDLKIVDGETGEDVPHDGESTGTLMVKGPWTLSKYWKKEEPCVDDDGWFDTGDVASIDPQGYMCITDRAKDVVKSGGR